MLYFYKSISPHKIESLHCYLDHFFTQVFAEANPTYDHAHHIHNDFREAIEEYKTQLDNKLKAIFDAYMGLSNPDKQIVQDAYHANIDIKNICNASVQPFKYSDLPENIVTPIKNLFNHLWGDNKVLGYKKIVAKCGTVKEHFNEFRKTNLNTVCPFCGLEPLLCEHDDGRDDYDHYLLKSKYPFIAVNFLNLVPMCHRCNSKNKGTADAVFIENSNPVVQRAIYYPFDTNTTGHHISIQIVSATTDLKDPKTWSIVLDCTPIANRPMKDAWVKIFNIETRYKARLSKDSYHWKDKLINTYRKKSKRVGFDFDEFRTDKIDDFDDAFMQTEAFIWKAFHEFLLNDPNFENNMKGVL